MDDLERMSNIDRCALLHMAEELRSRRRLEAIADVGAALSKNEGSKMHLLALAARGYGSDPEKYAAIVQEISKIG